MKLAGLALSSLHTPISFIRALRRMLPVKA